MCIGPEPDPSRPIPMKPDPENDWNPKPSPDPKMFGIVGFGIGRNRFVGIGRNRLVFSQFLARPNPSRPDPSPEITENSNRVPTRVAVGRNRSGSVCRYRNRASVGERFCSALDYTHSHLYKNVTINFRNVLSP